MGWDAFATRDGQDLERNWNHGSATRSPELIDPTLRQAFEIARTTVQALTGSADWLLCVGALDLETCAHHLQQATGMDCWAQPLTAEQVAAFNASADWNYETDRDGIYYSAKLFLETCAAQNLGIRFSY